MRRHIIKSIKHYLTERLLSRQSEVGKETVSVCIVHAMMAFAPCGKEGRWGDLPEENARCEGVDRAGRGFGDGGKIIAGLVSMTLHLMTRGGLGGSYLCALLFAPAHIPVTLSRLFCTSVLGRSGAEQTGNLRSSAGDDCLSVLSLIAACFASLSFHVIHATHVIILS